MAMITMKDHTGNQAELSEPPRRIVSLVPSQTELLYHLELDEKVVGITKFCVHPADWFRTKQRIGGTKTIDIEKLKRLQPDLVLANKEENVQEQVEAIATFAPVWVSDVNTLADAIAMITTIGELTQTQHSAAKLSHSITNLFNGLRNDLAQRTAQRPINAAYFIWKDPYMVAGGNTFINDMMSDCGLQNVYATRSRYPQIDLDELAALECEVLLLSSEPYPFKQKHVAELQQRLPGKLIMLVDGEMFSWYGSRLLLAAPYFAGLMQQVREKLPAI